MGGYLSSLTPVQILSGAAVTARLLASFCRQWYHHVPSAPFGLLRLLVRERDLSRRPSRLSHGSRLFSSWLAWYDANFSSIIKLTLERIRLNISSTFGKSAFIVFPVVLMPYSMTSATASLIDSLKVSPDELPERFESYVVTDQATTFLTLQL